MRRWLIVAVVVVACVACAAIPLIIRPGRFGQQTAQNIQQAVIDKGALRSVVTATGSIVAKGQSNLTFDENGVVTQLLVTEGQHVTTGQLLAQVDDSNDNFSLQQAAALVKASQASLDKLLEPVDPKDIAKAQADVNAAEASYSAKAGSINPNTIKAYQLQVKQAQDAVQAAIQQSKDAGGQYGSTDPNYLKTLGQVGIAENNADIAALKLQQVQAGSSLESATANIAYYQAKFAQLKAGTKQIDVDDAQAQLTIAQLQLDQAQHRLDHTRLVAPFAGTITTVNIKQGEVSSGTAIVLTDDSILYVDVQVDEADIGNIQLGQPVEITLDALPDAQLTGKVGRIDQIADTTASVITYTVRVMLDKTSAPIKVGMTANATFVVSSLENVLRIPNQFIKQNRSTGQTTVNLVNADGTYTEIAIKTGVQGPDYTEVIDGLQEGDTVALILNNPGQ